MSYNMLLLQVTYYMLYNLYVIPGGGDVRVNKDSSLTLNPQVPGGHRAGALYTRSPLEDSRLFGPSPWKILATTYETKYF